VCVLIGRGLENKGEVAFLILLCHTFLVVTVKKWLNRCTFTEVIAKLKLGFTFLEHCRSEVETFHVGRLLLPILDQEHLIQMLIRIATKMPLFQSSAVAEAVLRTPVMEEPCL